MFKKIFAGSALLACAPVVAQTVVNPTPVTVSPNQTATVISQQAAGNVLRVGAPVPVALSEDLTTKGKHLKVGQRVRLEVAQDVMLNGRIAGFAEALSRVFRLRSATKACGGSRALSACTSYR
jgi:hypothetical protein